MIPTSIVTTQRRARSPERPERSALEAATEAEFTPWIPAPAAQPNASLIAKRILDYVLAALFLLVCLPLFAAIAAGIKVTSPGPVLFVQKRVGKDGRVFPFFKFRTMKHNADDAVHREFSRDFICGAPPDHSLHVHGNGNGHSNGNGHGNGKANGNGHHAWGSATRNAKVYKLTRDPRVTAIGQFLRRTSLDELPQLFNVLRGEMSLVGPRPPVVYELEHYQDWHKQRLAAHPGITGLWQVSGRSSVPFDEMVLLDLYYIEHRSTLMDLRIMAKTLPVMLLGSGGY
jgi:lipopolysaccharide/colanic/teichoic acid biosynthesis glycosyltransferase